MAYTRYESYYYKIHEQIEQIRQENEYANNSIAFAHWYLKFYYKLNDQQIAESILDGADDLGIDALIIDEENKSLVVVQFKFPEKTSTINTEIDQGDIYKTLNGFKTLISNDRIYSGTNEKFADYKKQLQTISLYSFKIYFVSYNKGIIANRFIINNFTDEFRRETGSDLDVIYHERDIIANIYERLIHNNQIKITLKYKQMSPAYDIEKRKIGSYVGFANGTDIVEAISPYIATVFDENIRLYEYDSTVNSGIYRTATSTDEADMFYFYNNGVVFICESAKNSPASNEIIMDATSVVNGCQSLNVLYNAVQKGKLLSEVYILVRIIEISNYVERMKITEYLNAQTPIRDSYFIANHLIVRDLQQHLLEKGYYLERQINEVRYLAECGQRTGANNVIQLEDVIQYYTGYWLDKYASLSKRGKNALFDKSRIDEILSAISADKVIIAMETYKSISEVLTLYRKMRRNPAKDEFATYLGIDPQVVLQHIEDFRYMNTGDIILLNAVANIKKKYEELSLSIERKQLICDAIFLVKDIISAESETNTAQLTKSNNVFGKVQEKVKTLDSYYCREC